MSKQLHRYPDFNKDIDQQMKKQGDENEEIIWQRKSC